MTTARDLIKDSLRKIHVLGKGQSLDSDEADDALRLLNTMLSSWSVEGNLVYTNTKETFSLTGAGTYTIGSGLDFNTTAPLDIESAYVTQAGSDYPLLKYSDKEYSALTLKTTQGPPRVYYYDSNPTATIYLYPVDIGYDSITINSHKPLTSFTTLDTTYDMPAHYEIGLVYNLAVLISPEYEREPSGVVMKTAKNTKDAIVTQNRRNKKNLASLGVPYHGRTTGNIYSGWR